MGALVLVQAVNGQMLGIGRLAYSLGTHRQIPSVLSRLDARRSTPYVTIALAALIGFGLSLSRDIDFLAGIFAFGAMLAFTLAHLSVIVLRFREPDRARPFRIPLSVPVGRRLDPDPRRAGRAAGHRRLGHGRGAARGRADRGRRVDAGRRWRCTWSTGAARARR